MTSSDVVSFLEIWIDQLSLELGDGLHVVELQRVLVTILDLQLGPGHVDVDPGLLSVFFQLIDYLPEDHSADPGAKAMTVGEDDLVVVATFDLCFL